MIKPKNRQGITVIEILDTVIVSSEKYNKNLNYQKPFENVKTN